MEPKDYLRPPFAHYDILVYFGGGLFSIPFLYRYFIFPFGIPLPSFILDESKQITLEVIRGLSILMAVYVLGHIISYLSSQLVEKTVDRYIGKVSTAILVSMQASNPGRNAEIRRLVKERMSRIREDRAYPSAIIRALFHLPNLLHYILIYKAGIFGYLDTRIPPELLGKIEAKYQTRVVLGGQITETTKWYKPLEYYVMNNYPESLPRMYNYLVIAGLFRSLSFIFLWSSWFILFYLITYNMFETWPIGLTDTGTGAGAGIIEWFALSTTSVFCLLAYLKFQRRYTEEAIMSFVFAKDR